MLRTPLLMLSFRVLSARGHRPSNLLQMGRSNPLVKASLTASVTYRQCARPASSLMMLSEVGDDEGGQFLSSHEDLLTAFICKALMHHHRKPANCMEEVILEEAHSLLGNLRHLVSAGCQTHELMESPCLLYFSQQQIQARLTKLALCGITTVSMPILARANPAHSNSTVVSEIQDYLGLLDHQASSVSGLFQHLLQCSDDCIIQMLCKCPKLVTFKQIPLSKHKIIFLLENGWAADSICHSCLVLSYSSMKIIEERVDVLKEHNLHGKVPLYILRMTRNMFEKMTEKYKRWYVDLCEIASELGTSTSVLALIPTFNAPMPRFLPDKVKYLLNAGYSGQQIIDTAPILKFSLDRISAATQDLANHGVGMPDLPLLTNFVSQQKIPVRVFEKSNINFVAKLLQCNVSKLKVNGKRKHFKLQKKELLLLNYSFLHEQCVFSSSVIRELPHVLAHNPAVLQDAWLRLKQHPQFYLWQERPIILLNMLQYEVEKTCNFNHEIVL